MTNNFDTNTMLNSSENYYNLLEIDKNSDEETIKKAYKQQALRFHPDRNIDNKEESEIKTAIGEARRQQTLLWMKEEFELLCDILPTSDYTKKDYVTRKFAKCESCRKSRTKVLLPKSVVHFTTSKSDGKTCDFCGDVMTSTLPDLLPNRFEGRRGSRGDLNQGKLSTYLYRL